MRIITGLIFLINVGAWIALDVLCWSLTGGSLGWVGLIGIVIFLVAWGISGGFAVSVLDYVAQPEFDVFIQQLKWSNIAALFSMGLFLLLCLIFNWLNMREFLEISI